MEQQFAHWENPRNQNIALYGDHGTTYLLYFFAMMSEQKTYYEWAFGVHFKTYFHYLLSYTGLYSLYSQQEL